MVKVTLSIRTITTPAINLRVFQYSHIYSNTLPSHLLDFLFSNDLALHPCSASSSWSCPRPHCSSSHGTTTEHFEAFHSDVLSLHLTSSGIPMTKLLQHHWYAQFTNHSSLQRLLNPLTSSPPSLTYLEAMVQIISLPCIYY